MTLTLLKKLQTGRTKTKEQHYECELTKTFKYVSSIPAKMTTVLRSSLASNSNTVRVGVSEKYDIHDFSFS